MIGVPGRDTTDAMQRFVDEYGLAGMPQAIDLDGSLWARFGVSYQPAWVLIDDDGTTTVHPGALAGPDLDAALEELAGS